MSDTEYLVNSEKNKIRLQGSVNEAKGRIKDKGSIQYKEITEEVYVYVDVVYIANLLDGLNNSELFYIKTVCDMLIAKSDL